MTIPASSAACEQGLALPARDGADAPLTVGLGQGIIFMTGEDEYGVGNLVVYTDVSTRDHAALIAGRLLVAEGRVEQEVEHAEVPII